MSVTKNDAAEDPQRIIAELREQLRDHEAAREAALAENAVLVKELARRKDEFAERIDHQAATVDVLQAMAASPGDPQPVFDRIAAQARALCGGAHVGLFEFDGTMVHCRAAIFHNAPPDVAATYIASFPIPADQEPDLAFAIALREGRVVHIRDTKVDQGISPAGISAGLRSAIAVPLLRNGAVIGLMSLARYETGGMTDAQVELLKTFAKQAVIAITSAETWRALQTRSADLRESLKYQTATSDVLKVISRSAFDLDPALENLLAAAARLCDADSGTISTVEGDHTRTSTNYTREGSWGFPTRRGDRFPISRSTIIGRTVIEGRVIHVEDVGADPEHIPPGLPTGSKLSGTMLGVPLLRDGVVIGVIRLARDRVQPFSDRQIDLVTTFADQAVIAIENTRLITETREALERQTATADVLRVINANPGDPGPVFDAILESAHRVCGASIGSLWLYDGELIHAAATRGMTEEAAAQMRQPRPPSIAQERMIRERSRYYHSAEHRTDDAEHSPEIAASGARTIMGVPLVKDGRVIGLISARRLETRPFSEREIELLENFAAQAVIAMENARLLDEQREALERQTATAEVLQVINASPGNLAPVFGVILEKALRICQPAFGTLRALDGQRMTLLAERGTSAALAAWRAANPDETPSPNFMRMIETRRPVHLLDIREGEAYRSAHPGPRAAADLGGARTLLLVPLLKEDTVVGVLQIYRQEVRAFTDNEIALLENFAAQAVIAMENARLLTETREALEQQTATAEILRVINTSPGNLEPVFDSILREGMRLCGAAFGAMFTWDGHKVNNIARRGYPAAFAAYLDARDPALPVTSTILRLNETKRPIHIADLTEEEPYREGHPDPRATADLGGARTMLIVPLIKDTALLGYIVVYRQDVRLFADKDVNLLERFAAQAVIAMENARLLTETREALEQQTATAEVLQVINANPGDLAPVFEAVLDKAHRICGATMGALTTFDGELVHAVAWKGFPEDYQDRLKGGWRPEDLALGRELWRGERCVRIADLRDIDAVGRDEKDLTERARAVRRYWREQTIIRSCLYVPLRKDGAPLGFISAFRTEVHPFSDKDLELLETFAAQAVIAMENARLLTEQREALERQTATAEVLQVINASPGDLAPVFQTMLDRALRLCGAAFGELARIDGEISTTLALSGMPAAFSRIRVDGEKRPGPGTTSWRFRHGENLVHIPDLMDTDAYRDGAPERRTLVDDGGARALLAVALRKDDALLGLISIFREEPGAFSDKQIALLENFAAQAVIAMENARLLGELRDRTADLSARDADNQALIARQAASIEVLRAISASPDEAQPVLELILRYALALADAQAGTIVEYDGTLMHQRVFLGRDPDARDRFVATFPRPPSLETNLGRVILSGQVVHLPDVQADPSMSELSRGLGLRAFLSVPLLRDGLVIGVLGMGRYDPGDFNHSTIEMVQAFAGQAVIALSSAAALKALRERTSDLQESLEYQTATSDVLKVISRSTFDLNPVLQTLLTAAAQLCDADSGGIATIEGDGIRLATHYSRDGSHRFSLAGQLLPMTRATVHGRAALEGRIIHVEDIGADPDHVNPDPTRPPARGTMLGVPLLRDGAVIGSIRLARNDVRPFTERQIDLVSTFADQAVIAIENTRLLTEQQEALEQQTATAEVLGVINANPGDLAPVFDAVLEKAMRLCDISFGLLYAFDGQGLRTLAHRGIPSAFAALRTFTPPRIYPGGPIAVAYEARRGLQFPDLKTSPGYLANRGSLRQLVDVGGARTLLVVPLVHNDTVQGHFAFYRQQVLRFTDKQVALLDNFAAQAAIAMENARLLEELRQRTNDLQESLTYQTATSDVLKVISRSTFDLNPVLETLLNAAARLCDADSGGIATVEGDGVRVATHYSRDGSFRFSTRGQRLPLTRATILGRTAVEGRIIHVEDIAADPEHVSPDTLHPELRGTMLGVPLLRDGAVLGSIRLARNEVRPFTDRQIELVSTFADQAVIAIENTRLLTEQREALEQQTATAEILRVINANPGETKPVFHAILEKSLALAESAFGAIWLYDGDLMHAAATRGMTQALAAFNAQNPIQRISTSARYAIETGRSVQLADMRDGEAYRSGHPATRAFADLGGARANLVVPLIKEREPIGCIHIFRQEVHPFSDKQIALLESFAAQAVIAMENARLLTEQREALERQTATAEILRVINASPGELQPVFDTVLSNAMRLVGASFGELFTHDGERWTTAAQRGLPPAYAEFRRQNPPTGERHDSTSNRLLREKRTVHILDLAEEELYRQGGPRSRVAADLAGARTVVTVPLLQDATVRGCISIFRQEVRAFSEREIALVEGFATQATIAMANASLLNEVRRRQDELRVTFENMGDGVAMFDEAQRLVAWNRKFQDILDVPDDVLAERLTFSDYIRYQGEHGEYGSNADVEAQVRRLTGGTREHRVTERTRPNGRVIEIRNNPVAGGGFVVIYADITERKRNEAAIAAARDAAEEAARTIEAAYRDLKIAQANLVQSEKMASLGQLTAGIAHEIKNPLNFVNNFAALSVDLLAEFQETAAPAIALLTDDQRADIDDVAAMLTTNLRKIEEHGKRADGIVKAMLEHSRGSSGERREVDLNALVDEALNLAYHGARAQDQSFNITLERDFATDLTPIELNPQDMTRVFLNMFSNGFYAANKRAKEGAEPGFQPVLKVSTRAMNDAVEIRIRDNGTGIPPDIRDKLFQPFFTTKPTGEGTGLGLSITYDIVTKAHGGTITVESEVGAFTEFVTSLPRHMFRDEVSGP